MNYMEKLNTSKSYIFRKAVPANDSGHLIAPLVGHGIVTACHIRCAVGDEAKLHIRPVVVYPGEIETDIFNYAIGGDKYISGDDETIENQLSLEIENHACLKVYYDNTETDAASDPAQLSVDIEVSYFDTIEPENIIGPNRYNRG